MLPPELIASLALAFVALAGALVDELGRRSRRRRRQRQKRMTRSEPRSDAIG